MDRLAYPSLIIPRKYYINRLNVDLLAESKHYYIVRRSPKPLKETFHLDTLTLREDAINTKEVPDLSMNILGGRFKINHLKFRCFNNGMKIWTAPKKIKLKQYISDFEKLVTSTPIFFKLMKIHNKHFPYYRSTQDKETAKIIKALNLLPEVDANGNNKFSGSCSIIHSPNMLNYWHVEFELKDVQDEKISKVKNGWTGSAADMAFLQILSMAATPTIRKIAKIPLKEYIKLKLVA